MFSLSLSCPQCNKLTVSEACGAQKHLSIALARKTVEVTAGSGGHGLFMGGWGSGDAQNRVHSRGTWCWHRDSPTGLVQQDTRCSLAVPWVPFHHRTPPCRPSFSSLCPSRAAGHPTRHVPSSARLPAGPGCIPGRGMLSLPFAASPKVMPWL